MTWPEARASLHRMTQDGFLDVFMIGTHDDAAEDQKDIFGRVIPRAGTVYASHRNQEAQKRADVAEIVKEKDLYDQAEQQWLEEQAREESRKAMQSASHSRGALSIEHEHKQGSEDHHAHETDGRVGSTPVPARPDSPPSKRDNVAALTGKFSGGGDVPPAFQRQGATHEKQQGQAPKSFGDKVLRCLKFCSCCRDNSSDQADHANAF